MEYALLIVAGVLAYYLIGFLLVWWSEEARKHDPEVASSALMLACWPLFLCVELPILLVICCFRYWLIPAALYPLRLAGISTEWPPKDSGLSRFGPF